MSGIVTLRDFDLGMVTTIGGELITVSMEDGERQQYVVSVPGVEGPALFDGKIPIVVLVGSTPYNPVYYPCIIIRSGDPTPALENAGTYYSVDYRKRANGALERSVVINPGTDTEQTVTGYTSYETKARAVPFNINYEVSLYVRGDQAHSQSVTMYMFFQMIFVPPGFGMTLIDSVGDTRGYDVMMDSVSSIRDTLDLTDRNMGWTFSLVVHGELDLMMPYNVRAMTGLPETNLDQF